MTFGSVYHGVQGIKNENWNQNIVSRYKVHCQTMANSHLPWAQNNTKGMEKGAASGDFSSPFPNSALLTENFRTPHPPPATKDGGYLP